MNPRPCEQSLALFSDFLADEIVSKDLAALEAHLDTCAGCRERAVELARQNIVLCALAARESVKGVTERFRAALGAPSEESTRVSHRRAVRPSKADPRRIRRRSGARIGWILIAASLLIGAVAILARTIARPVEPPAAAAAIARIERVNGEAYLLRGESKDVAVAGAALFPGHALRTAGSEGRVLIVFPDRTSIEIGPDAEARELSEEAGRGKRLSLLRGALTADVSRQAANQAMVFRTPQAEATVLGTTLRLTADTASTALHVVEGAVRIRRLADGKAVDVLSGQEAVVAPDAELSVRDKRGSRSQDSKNWRAEQWTLEDFTSSLAGGPGVGPALESGASAISLCGDKSGRLYLLNGNSIDIITPEGFRTRLAGTGVRGYRDGPANQAQFDQGGSYNVPRSIQCDERGNVYMAENGNNRVRRISKNSEGKWVVETVAGGGKRRLKPGESCVSTEADLGGGIAVAAAPDGTLTVGQRYGGFYRIPSDGRTITHLGGWPETSKGTLVGADGDRHGNAYFIWRRDDGGVVKVSASGAISPLGGMMYEEMAKLGRHKMGAPKPHHIGDGPPLVIFIDTPSSVAADPEGTCVYSCGGDEYYIRRIPSDPESTTATLMQNGRWHVLPAHPNKLGGGSFDPARAGKSKLEGGSLAGLYTCHLVGRDYEGNLYGFLYSWVGDTQTIAGRGPLSTKVYRLRRSK